ncbi:hypothetical protein T439DRAFT_77202 [Meredithblackwellia eburnea MCA 4105]
MSGPHPSAFARRLPFVPLALPFVPPSLDGNFHRLYHTSMKFRATSSDLLSAACKLRSRARGIQQSLLFHPCC